MAGRNYYVVLGVQRDATPRRIRRAYLDLAKRYHPDVIGESGKESFQEIREAYETLSDPGKRSAYNHVLNEAEARERRLRSARPAETLAAEPMSLFHGEARYQPSHAALFDQILRSFMGIGIPKSERREGLNLEVILTPEEASRGVTLPVGVPTFHVCPFCDGTGREWVLPCAYCQEKGVVEREETVRVRIPPMVRPGTVFELPLEGMGIHNLYLRLHVFVE